MLDVGGVWKNCPDWVIRQSASEEPNSLRYLMENLQRLVDQVSVHDITNIGGKEHPGGIA
jgi:hypothetical protein